MPGRVTVIVRCGHRPSWLMPTLTSVHAQQAEPADIALLTDASTPARALPWIRALASSRGYRHVAGNESANYSSHLNQAVAIVDTPLIQCINAGEQLAPTCLARLAARLDQRPGDSMASTLLLRLGPGASQTIQGSRTCDLRILLVDADAAASQSMFRRSAWDRVGGFDETLAVLEHYEFWLRLITDVGPCSVVDDALVVQPRSRDALYRLAWNGAARRSAMRSIVERHAGVFRVDPVHVLVARLEQRLALSNRYQDALLRYRQLTGEIDRLAADASRIDDTQGRRPVIDLGDLRRTSPISREWGYDRGVPVDRVYIERFLERHADDVKGAVLEIQEPDYTQRFGGNRVTTSDVLDVDAGNPRATVVADLRSAPNIRTDSYDCIILTQTLHVIDDMPAVVAECERILKPGGVILATFPCASRVSVEYGTGGDHWRVTADGARRTFAESFAPADLEVAAHGNVLTNTAFLHGLAADEIEADHYGVDDPYFPLIVTVRARKPLRRVTGWDAAAHITRSRADRSHSGSAVLLYHRVAAPASDVHGLSVSAEDFRDQMNWLRNEYRVLPLQQLVEAAVDGTLPPGAIALTFDDGCIDNLTVASPILMELGLPATFFITTEALDQPYEYWWVTLERLLLSPTRRPPGALPDDGLAAHLSGLPTDTWETRRTTHDALYQVLIRMGSAARDDLMQHLRMWAGDTQIDDSARRMNVNELRELAARPGHTIGAHTAGHRLLPGVEQEEVQREVEKSRSELSTLLDTDIRAFAYPFGACDGAARQAVEAVGLAVGLICGDAAIARHPDALALPRLDPGLRDSESFPDWLVRRVGPGRSSGLTAPMHAAPALRDRPGPHHRRAIVAGWFSYAASDFTAGDLLACDLVCDWLREAGLEFDVALVEPLAGGVSLDQVRPDTYSHAVFVCGPFMRNAQEEAFARRFRACRLMGVNLSMPVPLGEWNPFDVLLARNSSEGDRADITFGSSEPLVPVVGVCLVEPYGGADVATANAAVATLLAKRHVSVVSIDSRLDVNTTGLRTKAEVESLVARMDLVVTTRLHGTVLALKHGVPALVIDPEPGGFRLKRQADALGWPAVFTVDAMDPNALEKAFDYCLSPDARTQAAACRDRGLVDVEDLRRQFVAAASEGVLG